MAPAVDGKFKGGAADSWFGKAPATLTQQLRFFLSSVVVIMGVNKLCRGSVFGELHADQQVYLPFARRREKGPPDSKGFVE